MEQDTPEQNKQAVSSGGPTGADPDKRERILLAATQVFADKGFFHARVSDVAKAAKVADGTIYLYFRDKDDILISLFEDRMDEILNRFRIAIASCIGPVEQLRALIRAHGSMVQEEPKLAQVIQVELRQSNRFMKEYTPVKFGELLRMIENLVRAGIEQGVFRNSLHPGVAKRAVYGAMDEVALHWVTGNDRYDVAETYEQLAEILIGGLCATCLEPAGKE